MSKKGVIVKRLAAIQNFGSMDVLCADKTGTLTENRVTVILHVDVDGKDSEKVLALFRPEQAATRPGCGARLTRPSSNHEEFIPTRTRGSMKSRLISSGRGSPVVVAR